MAEDKEVERLREELEEIKEMVRSIGEGEIGGVERQSRLAMRGMREKARMAMGKSREMGYQAKQYVEENPWNAVGIALAIGFISGIIVGRRK